MTQCTPDEAEDRYERIITSSLAAVSNLAKELSLSNDFVLFIKTEPELDSESEGLGAVLYGFRNIFNKRFWSDVTTHNSPLIRRASYKLISELCNLIPGAIYRNPSSKSVQENLRKSVAEKAIPLNKIADIFCQFLNEKSSSNIPAMFLAFLSFSKNFPKCWNYISIDQVFVTRIKALLANHLQLTLDHLLPLFGSIPTDVVAIFNLKSTDVSTYCDYLDICAESLLEMCDIQRSLAHVLRLSRMIMMLRKLNMCVISTTKSYLTALLRNSIPHYTISHLTKTVL